MTQLEEKLARINEIANEFAGLASSSASGIVDLSDEQLAEMVGESGLESAVLAHQIVGKLRDAAGQLEVLAYTLNRRASRPQLPGDGAGAAIRHNPLECVRRH